MRWLLLNQVPSARKFHGRRDGAREGHRQELLRAEGDGLQGSRGAGAVPGGIAQEVATQFGWSCGRSTLSKIISMDWKLLRSSHEGGEAPRNPNMKRRRRPLFPAFEADLVKFIFAHVGEEGGTKSTSEQSPSVEIACGGNTTSVAEDKGTQSSEVGDSRRRPLTEALILEEAQRLKQVHGVSDEMLMLSVGWLARFKHRHCIRLRKPAGVANKCRIPQHQQDVSAEPVLMGAWSAGLMSASLSQPQVLIGRIVASPTHGRLCVGDTGDLLPSSSQQGVNLELASGSEGQWLQRKRHCALRSGITSIRELACTCQKYDDCIGAIGGLKVAVVGFGSVVDAFLLAEAVGADGSVVCVEASASNIYAAEQIAETRKASCGQYEVHHGEYSGMPQSSSYIEGELKNLQGRVDLVICNCSIQSLEFPASKNAVLELAFSLLKVGGELRVTDLVCSRRLSSSECEEARLAMTATKLLLGAPYVGDLKRLFRALGADVEVRTESCNEADAAAIDGAVASLLPPLASASNVQFRRVTFHAFRIQDVEEPREDYGQTAIFNGSDVGGKAVVGTVSSPSFRLDDEWNFERGVRTPIDGNTAQILQTTWMQRYFSVSGDHSRHRGPFVARIQTFSATSAATSAPGSTLDSSEDARIADQSTLAISPPSPEPLEIANI
ncbi:S-adenosyl-L-methionine-dependent methyltransferase [Phytophthora cactorum]|nr:S-adenosyl-L-methionine-dependent methyltransferase [Phytophthora cactorum]